MATRTNKAWLSDLRAEGERRSAALDDLRSIIHKGLPYALSRSGCWWSSYKRSPTGTVLFLLLIKHESSVYMKKKGFFERPYNSIFSYQLLSSTNFNWVREDPSPYLQLPPWSDSHGSMSVRTIRRMSSPAWCLD